MGCFPLKDIPITELLNITWDNKGVQVYIPLVEGIKGTIDILNPVKDDPTAFNRLIENNETRE